MHVDYMKTPMGIIEIQSSREGVTKVSFSTSKINIASPGEITSLCKQQLGEYFSGKLKKFDLPLEQHGTIFQKKVWACLAEIPFGQAVSYRDIAEMINNRNAVRAVGLANSRNLIGIIVPCHRVIGSNRTLTGYAGGLDKKAWLLEHEGVVL